MTQNQLPSNRRAFLNRAAPSAPQPRGHCQRRKADPSGRHGPFGLGVVGANDRIQLGMIGMGGHGHRAPPGLHEADRKEEKDLQIMAVSDIYTRRKQRARDIAKLTDKDVHHDYRDRWRATTVDAVLIAAPDHWHGQMALDALAAAARTCTSKSP
jgi:hypothetical protein